MNTLNKPSTTLNYLRMRLTLLPMVCLLTGGDKNGAVEDALRLATQQRGAHEAAPVGQLEVRSATQRARVSYW
jgi:hypothetical protein